MINVTPVIMCGGSGPRLWPLSRTGFPKQFLSLSGTKSLYQQTVERACHLGSNDIQVESIVVVTNEEHRFLSQEQLRQIKATNVTFLLEPAGRNTAPALTLAALRATECGNDPILVVTPADQVAQDEHAFRQAIERSIQVANEGGIVVLGISPTRPETGYGYIQQTGHAGINGEFIVEQFREKPNFETASAFLLEGNYTWNSGIFVLRASIWLKALQHFCNEIYFKTEKAWQSKTIDKDFIRPDKNAFLNVPSLSIDYAVMEKCPSSAIPIHMVPLSAGWSDLGAWDAVWQADKENPLDDFSNSVRGDALLINTRGSLIHSTSRLVAAVGVSNLIVVETPDAVLVADRSQSQDVKKLVQKLELNGREELTLHRKVHRPWGWYDTIDEGERFKVKRIQVNPGASLSLQMHHHRAEHWVVVKGTAEITNGDKIFLLNENQSTYIPVGVVHRLTNPSTIPLEIIEVQSGDYLGEDDIVRFDDSYGRTS